MDRPKELTQVSIVVCDSRWIYIGKKNRKKVCYMHTGNFSLGCIRKVGECIRKILAFSF